MLHKYGIRPRGEHHCTQIAQKITWPDYNAGLDFVTRMHTDIPYYKADGKKWMKVGGSWSEWWSYNAMDSIATASARGPQIEELQLQHNLETYNRQRALVSPLLYMMERGIRVDVEGMKREQEKEQHELEQLQEKLNELAGYELNSNSPKQLIDYFYDKKGIKPYKKRSTTGAFVPTTDVDALKRLAKPTSTRKGYEEAQIILKMRGLQKRISTYLSIKKLDHDGRMRSQYKPAGTDTGRLASGETIFGLGGNQQNIPHDILQFFLADDGYLLVSIDLSQIENRIVAYVGNVAPMIKAFETGVDVHSLTTAMIFDKPIEQVSDEDGSCDLGDGSQSERYWGKKANHGLNYDLGYKNFALRYEITEKEANWIVEKYHQSYPGVRQNYHAMIQSQLKEDRTITNLFGRRRIFMGPIVPDYPNVSKGHCHNTFKEAYAHLPQSTTADKINEHGVNYIYYNQQWFAPVELLTQIHDSVVFQIPLSLGWVRMAEIIRRVKDSLEQPLKWHDREFKVPADTSIGLNMFKKHMKEIKSKNFPYSLADLAKLLEETYDSLIARK
jgi:DNA polymerase-1